jgi:hypothetical protein
MPSFGSCEPIITDYPSPPPPPSIITNHASQTAIIRPPSPSSNSIATIQPHRQSIHVALSLCRHVRVSCSVLMSCILSCHGKQKTLQEGRLGAVRRCRGFCICVRLVIVCVDALRSRTHLVLLYNSLMAQAQLPIVDDTPAALKMSSAVLCEKQAPKM